MNLEKYIIKQLREAYTPLSNQEKVDSLLDKINNNGWDSLDSEERETLRNVGGGHELPPLKKVGSRLMTYHSNPILSSPVTKPDGTVVRGVKSRGNGIALAIIYQEPEGKNRLSFNKELWDFLRNSTEVTDLEVVMAIKQWAASELALDVYAQYITPINYVMK
jgi:hypothetical protein